MQIISRNFNTNFKSAVSYKDIESLSEAEQYFSDCYIASSLDTLSHSTNGIKKLRENIQYNPENPNYIDCYLGSKYGREKYTVPVSEVLQGYEKLYEHQANPILRSVDVAVSNQVSKYKTKNMFCAIADGMKDYNFEFGFPSQFMESITGVKPTYRIAEGAPNYNLKPYKKQVMKLFKEMDKNKEHSFVIGSGVKKLDDKRFHVYVLEDVDLKNDAVTVKNKRGNKRTTMTVDEALSNFKYIVGYFNADLK